MWCIALSDVFRLRTTQSAIAALSMTIDIAVENALFEVQCDRISGLFKASIGQHFTK